MNNYLPKNILVTGSAGFIGSNFVHSVLKNDAAVKVISLDKLTYAGSLKNLDNLPDPSRHVFVQGDICDRALVDGLLRQHNIDSVVHFAAESHVDRSITGPGDFIQTNIFGTFTLIEAARKFWLEEQKLSSTECRFHHVSTDEVYGELTMDEPAFTEKTPYAPSSPYSSTKASSDHLVRAYFRTYKLPVTVSNCSNNYGPHQHPEKLIPTVIKSCIAEQPIPIYGNGSNMRDWLYVEDHCNAIITILAHGQPGETYNIGGNCELANLTLAKMICTIMDEKLPSHAPHSKLITFVTDRPGHDWRYAIDATKMKQQLSWEPQYKIIDGLHNTIDYYLNLFTRPA